MKNTILKRGIIKRRVLLGAAGVGALSIAELASGTSKGKIEKLATDPNGERYVYKDGYILKVN